MTYLSRLLKVGSMTESLGVYVPTTVLRQVLGVGRMLLFVYLLQEAGYGLWGLGVAIFTLASSLVTLGSHHGLVRYVSFHEARGQLQEFYRRMRWRVLACAAVLTVAAFAGSDVITRMVMVSRSGAADYHQQLRICRAALANAALLGLYHNMLGFLVGMRRYRVVSVLELLFAVLFTALGIAAILAAPEVVALLAAHFIALAVVFVAGMFLLHRAVKSLDEGVPSGPGRSRISDPESDTAELDVASPPPDMEKTDSIQEESSLDGFFARVLRFGFIAALAGFLWQGAGYVSFLLTSRRYGQAQAGVFFAFLPLGQSIMVLANAARAVIFAHVAKIWETGEHKPAIFILETAYKALVIGTMSLTVLLYVTSPAWVKVLPEGFREGLTLLGGLLLFFQASIHLALLNSLARLHERPIVVALGPLVGGVVIVVLAQWWMERYGPAGAALAAGVGMYAGMMVVSLAYFLTVRVRLHMSTYFVLAVPIMLLLPLWEIGLVWIAVLFVTISTTWMLNSRQKRIIGSSIRRIYGRIGLIKRPRFGASEA